MAFAAAAFADAPPSAPLVSSQPAPVTGCDLYAAGPNDPERQSPGVDPGNIDVAKALPACEAASEAYPRERRFRYQLARSFQAAKDFGKAREIFSELDADGYAAATASLGWMHQQGEGLAKDAAEAVRLYRKAKDLGNAHAMALLGYMYLVGEGVEKDVPEALQLLRKAAGMGDALAMGNLALMHEKGEGVARDKAEAVRLWREAAGLGEARAIAKLGYLYDHGDGVPKDKAEAARLYQKAVDLGSAAAMQNFAVMYEFGEGVEANRGRAAELIVMAIKKQNGFTLQQAPFEMWSEEFRKELQRLLQQEGVYEGSIDGKASEALKSAALALAAKSKNGG